MFSDSLLVRHIFNAKQDSVRKNLLIICCVAICFWYLQTLWKKRKLYWYSWNVPGPLALPVIGSAYMFLTLPVTDALQVVHNITKRYPKIAKIWFGSNLLYGVYDPVYIEKILKSPNAAAKDGLFYLAFKDIFRESLITAEVHTWRKHRKLIAPSFNQKILDSFVEIFVEQSEVFADQLKKRIGQKDIEIYLLATRCTLDIICQTAMGVDMHIQTTNGDLGLVLEKIFDLAMIRTLKIWYKIGFIWKMSSPGKQFKQNLVKLFSITGSVVKRKMQEYEKRNNCEYLMAEIEEEPVVKRLAFLDLVLENSNFTEEELKAEVDLFLLAVSYFLFV
ncbi:unnamed protein product [Acanthoscelides obtectus]|nr:unnamed protein product [Acanthoscelides obtectus]CAK1677180.1 Cytochrome P450 4C1 [Acanthoscelides obtectus]